MEILTAPLQIGTDNMGFSAQFPTKKGPGNLTPNVSIRIAISTGRIARNEYFQARVGKELPAQFPEPPPVGKQDGGHCLRTRRPPTGVFGPFGPFGPEVPLGVSERVSPKIGVCPKVSRRSALGALLKVT